MSKSDPRSEGVVAELAGNTSDIFFAAVQTTLMPMLVTDPRQPDNPVVFANKAFLSMTGYTPQEVLGRNCRFLQGPHTDPATIELLREAVRRREDRAVEILNYRKDGSSFWNALFIAPIFNSEGEVVLFFSSQLDVSRRRDAEESLSQARKLEALGHLTGGIAHDFNNLLQIVVGHLDMIGLQLVRKHVHDAGLELAIERARGAAERASSLTQQLLAFARRQRLSGRVVNISTLAAGLSEMAHRTIGDNYTIEFDCDRTLPNTEIDPTQFEVAVLNLLVNARDAMPGGGTITVSTGRSRIGPDQPFPEGGLPVGDYVFVEVADRGHGIPAEVLPRVMEPFFTTKADSGGTGLGLSTIYGFVKQSGGTATIDSAPGQGTRVRLVFPVSDKSMQAAAVAGPMPLQRGGRETVLVVDDRVDVADLTASMLASLGYRVLTAHSGAEALGLLRTAAQPPDLIVTDVVMPGSVDGYGLVRAARRLIPQLPILLVSGFDSERQRPQADPDSEFHMLRKPFRLEELARVVRTLLDGATGSTKRPA